MSAAYTSLKERVEAAEARNSTRARAKRMHVTIEERFSGGWHEILLTAPDGMRFKNSELHELVIANAGPTTDQLWQRAQRELEYEADVELCDVTDCEWCSNE